ncbi:MAG: hypothetical protein V3S14_05560 [Anaerolineae bacterium]
MTVADVQRTEQAACHIDEGKEQHATLVAPRAARPGPESHCGHKEHHQRRQGRL